MLIGRVTGRVVATVRAEGLTGVRFLLLQPLDEQLAPIGTALVAADATNTAGPGDLVHYEGGREAALALETTFVKQLDPVTQAVDEYPRYHREDAERTGLPGVIVGPDSSRLVHVPDGEALRATADQDEYSRAIGAIGQYFNPPTIWSPSNAACIRSCGSSSVKRSRATRSSAAPAPSRSSSPCPADRSPARASPQSASTRHTAAAASSAR